MFMMALAAAGSFISVYYPTNDLRFSKKAIAP